MECSVLICAPLCSTVFHCAPLCSAVFHCVCCVSSRPKPRFSTDPVPAVTAIFRAETVPLNARNSPPSAGTEDLYEQNCTIMSATTAFTVRNLSLQPKLYFCKTGAPGAGSRNTTEHNGGSLVKCVAPGAIVRYTLTIAIVLPPLEPLGATRTLHRCIGQGESKGGK